MRTVVSDKDEILFEIDRMKLREAATDFQPILDQHRDAGLQIGLAAHRKARGGQQ